MQCTSLDTGLLIHATSAVRHYIVAKRKIISFARDLALAEVWRSGSTFLQLQCPLSLLANAKIKRKSIDLCWIPCMTPLIYAKYIAHMPVCQSGSCMNCHRLLRLSDPSKLCPNIFFQCCFCVHSMCQRRRSIWACIYMHGLLWVRTFSIKSDHTSHHTHCIAS